MNSLTPTAAVPETCKAELEDIDVLFETNPTWLIGPGSRKKLAVIIENRQASDVREKYDADLSAKGTVEIIENS